MKKKTKRVKSMKSTKNPVTIGFINNKIRIFFSKDTKFDRPITVTWISPEQVPPTDEATLI